MKTTVLGRSWLRVSRIASGTLQVATVDARRTEHGEDSRAAASLTGVPPESV
jgi:hypothetical protein